MPAILQHHRHYLHLPVVAGLVILLASCGGDGNNVSDNTLFGARQGTPSGNTVDPSVTVDKVGSPLAIDTEDLGNVESHTAVVDSSGNVTVVWTQDDGTNINLWARRYSGGSWGTAQKIDNSSAANVLNSPKLVVDSGGNVMAIWVQDTAVTGGFRTDLYAARYTGSWNLPEVIDAGDLSDANTIGLVDIGAFELVIDSADVITAVWTQHDGTRSNLHAKRFTGTWGASLALNSYVATSVNDDLRPVLDSNNNLFITWTQTGPNNARDFWVVRYNNAGSAWGADFLVGDGTVVNTGVEGAPQLVADSAGNAMAVWVQKDSGAYNNLWARHYNNGAAWDAAVKIENQDLGDIVTAQLAVTGVNVFHAVWNQYDGTVTNLWANRYSGVWGVAAEIETDDTGAANSPNLVVDTSGNVTAVWTQGDGTLDNLWVNRYSAGIWGTESMIESSDDGSVSALSVLIDASDRITAIWKQPGSSGNFDLWSNRADASGSWAGAELIESLDNGSANDPRTVLHSASGNIIAVWEQPVTYVDQILTSTYEVGSGWTEVTQVEPASNNEGTDINLVIDGSGNATVIWRHPDTSGAATRFDLWANRI